MKYFIVKKNQKKETLMFQHYNLMDSMEPRAITF
jgi:hypothetical protein